MRLFNAHLLLILFLSIFFGSSQVFGSEDLIEELSYGEEERVRKALANGANPNQISRELEMTALMVAVETMKPKIVKLMLESKANPNLKVSSTGKTALMLFMERYYLKEQRSENGESIALEDENGINILQQLLQAGANPLEKDKEGKSVLAYAVSSREVGASPTIIQSLLKAKADPKQAFSKSMKKSICQMAIESENGFPIEAYRTFVQNKTCPPNANYEVSSQFWQTPLFMAVSNNDLATARVLLEAGANPDIGAQDIVTDYVPIFASLRNPSMFYQLLEFGANPNSVENDVHILEHIARTAAPEELAMRYATSLVQRESDPNHIKLFGIIPGNKALYASNLMGKTKLHNFLEALGARDIRPNLSNPKIKSQPKKRKK